MVIFKNKKYHKDHKCPFRPDVSFMKSQNINPVVLNLPKKWKETVAVMSQLCSEDVVEMCRLQDWCLPHFYPFCFPHQLRAGHLGLPPVLEKMTASKSSSQLFKQMVDMHGEVVLPKYIILKDTGVGHHITFLSPNVLTPTSDFTFTELFDSFVVKKDDTNEETIDKHCSDDSTDNVMYCHLAPAYMQDSCGGSGDGDAVDTDDQANDGSVDANDDTIGHGGGMGGGW